MGFGVRQSGKLFDLFELGPFAVRLRTKN